MKKNGCLILLIIILFGCTSKQDLSDAYGNFESVEIVVSAELNGKILSFPIEEGDEIQVGQTLCRLDSTQLVLQLKELDVQLAISYDKVASLTAKKNSSEIDLSTLKTDRDRYRQLLIDHAVSQQTLDSVEGKYNALQKMIESLGAQIKASMKESHLITIKKDRLKDQLSKTIVSSPITGTILTKYSNRGEFISTGRKLVKIADLSTMIMRGYIGEKQLSEIKIGDEVEVLTDQAGNHLRSNIGTITWIASEAEFTPKTVQTRDERSNLVYAIKVQVINDGSLKIGMPGEIRFK